MRRYCIVILLLAITAIQVNGQIIPPPVKDTSSNNNNPENCYNRLANFIVLSGDSILRQYPGSKFLWEYRLNPPVGAGDTYSLIGFSQTNKYSFTGLTAFGTPQIDTQTNRYIRVRHVSADNSTVYGISATVPTMFSPSAPEFLSTEVLPTASSCINTPTGAIHIRLRKYTDTVLYVVRIGGNTSFCNPVTNNPPCLNVLRSGKTADTNFVITGVPAGQYAVIISNVGSLYGACNDAQLAYVDVLPPIQVDSTAFKNPYCYNEASGEISLQVSGGDPASYRFGITPQAGAFSYNNGTAKYSNLLYGNYLVTFKDTCGLIIGKNFTLINPPRLEGQVIKTIPDCASPGNGVIKIIARYNFTAPGYTQINYKLYKNGLAIDSLMNTTDTSFTKTGLTGGNYRAVAYSSVNPTCTGVDETFLLPFNPLTISVDSVRHASCNGSTDGYVQVKATGGTGQYKYSLRNNSTGQVLQDSTSVFSNLPAATYTAISRNKTTSCGDSSVVSITINQPQPITSNVTRLDIQCYNFSNGQLKTIAAGGNGNYTYQWEKQNPVNGTWASYFQTGDSIGNVGAGVYRSKITDNRNCVGYSLPVTIIEPDSLRIDSVVVADIPCFAGSGHITVYSRGGNAGHVQQYRKLPDNDYLTFTPATGLSAGSYLVRVKDGNNCITLSADTIRITAPPSNLNFTYTQETFNGYNITCFGADDGIIVINATGGNGDGYSGYYYTYDNQPWQTGNTITNIPAGQHDIKVKDARGCIIIKQVSFRQPTDSLSVTLLSTTHVQCFGSSTGAISIKANGGVRPYRFSINNGTTYQSDSSFMALPAGSYTVLVRDANNCAGYITATVNSLYTAITANASITHVSCNGLADGSINATASGGNGPYSYLWTPGNATTASISSLSAGNYSLLITDAAGCQKQFTYAVTQPGTLNPLVQAYPVCYGSSTGKIIITPVGGTAPYQYSKDGGTTYQTDSTFNALPQATYSLKVKDARQCTWTGTATVGAISNNPNLNFIISSNQQEQDTITMKEISWIKPDSVKWQFHPSATIIDPNPLEPKIKFAHFDTTAGYWIRLIGYYPTCTYMVEKGIKIYPYDPNAVVAPSAYNKGIKKAELFPNPNNGQFTLNVEFYKMQKVSVYVTSVPGVIVMPKQTFPTTMHLIKNFLTEMSGAQPGTYIMRIVSDYDSRNILFVKQ